MVERENFWIPGEFRIKEKIHRWEAVELKGRTHALRYLMLRIIKKWFLYLCICVCICISVSLCLYAFMHIHNLSNIISLKNTHAHAKILTRYWFSLSIMT